jgi:serine/threonine-protein kinase RsbW
VLALYSSPGLLSVVRGTVERLTEYLGFPITEARSITRAVDEALTNIVRHSYRNLPGQPITMYFRRARRHRQCEEVKSGLEVLLYDRGPAVDPSKFRGRRLEEIRPGGIGLVLHPSGYGHRRVQPQERDEPAATCEISCASHATLCEREDTVKISTRRVDKTTIFDLSGDIDFATPRKYVDRYCVKYKKLTRRVWC